MMASQSESQKAGTEETKDKANRTVEDNKKSEDDTATNEQTDDKQTKIEDEDSEENEFEIIGTEVVASTNEIKLEAIGPIVNNDEKSEEIAVSDDTKGEIKLSQNETFSMKENVAVLKENDKESAEPSLMDIDIIKESKDNSNKDVPESEAASSDNVEEALTAIPEMSLSLSKEILAESDKEREAKRIIERIETKPEENQDVTLLDITIIEETNKDNFVQDTTKEAENSFEAEVIDDIADIEVVPSDGEDVIEYTVVAGDVIPFLTILVAFVAIIVALGYYYNNADNALVTQDVMEDQEEQEEDIKEGEILWF
eukprot:TRINITY_DN8453_c0_g1_i1.p1 TRINITY_DN8453_c0_g1~~TRINITY_DN8453_c0_g1_i1.p1  ORF type:complete len:313 (-),score=119.41 TRINITY_DN8453_c0_g1_i1:97-1035(-)